MSMILLQGGLAVTFEKVEGEKILIILTGGTICSCENAEGKRSSDTETARYKIVANFKGSD